MTFALVILWGLINRLRGWGGGWNLTNEPKWLVWMQIHLFSRPILSATQAFLTALWYHHQFDAPFAACGLLFVALFGFWWLAVAPGWGEYFDGLVVPNHEIKWIDSAVAWGFSYLPPRWGQNAALVDNVSFGLRGAYYLPMFAAVAAIHCYFFGWSWWLMLPAAFFWQDGVVYGLARKVLPSGDFVALAEKCGGVIRCGLVVFSLLAAK